MAVCLKRINLENWPVVWPINWPTFLAFLNFLPGSRIPCPELAERREAALTAFKGTALSLDSGSSHHGRDVRNDEGI